MPRRSSGPSTPGRTWKIGELAERTGLTVRTLHHYDAVGLLKPTDRTNSVHGSGHRLYTTADVTRLQQILSLKCLGFGLEQIREYLARPEYDPRLVVRLHLERVREQANELNRLAARLAALSEALDKAETVSVDEFLTTIEEMAMIEKYYTPEQLALLQRRREEVGEDVIRLGTQQWADLQADVQAAMDAGIEPTDARAAELAHRWFALVSGFTGGDPGVFQSLKKMYQNEDAIRGMDVAAMRPGMDWIQQAAAAAGINLPGA